jgi:predicted CopG family antitoxin
MVITVRCLLDTTICIFIINFRNNTMKATISLDNSVLEQLLAYTQAKTAKESIAKAIEEYIRFKQRQELHSCRGSVEIDNKWQQLRDLERPS